MAIWIYIIYTLDLYAVAIAIPFTEFRTRGLYAQNPLILILGMQIPLLTRMLYNLGITPIRGYDLTPARVSGRE